MKAFIVRPCFSRLTSDNICQVMNTSLRVYQYKTGLNVISLPSKVATHQQICIIYPTNPPCLVLHAFFISRAIKRIVWLELGIVSVHGHLGFRSGFCIIFHGNFFLCKKEGGGGEGRGQGKESICHLSNFFIPG